MHRALVTGGAGFIGSHLVDRLLAEGYHVIAVDNLARGKTQNLARSAAHPGFEYVHLDLRDMDRLLVAMRGVQTVFHLAAHADVRQGASDTRVDLENGTIATWNVLEAMRLNDVSAIVFASSATVYGETSTMPISENYGPELPISIYGASKLSSEAFISAFSHTFDFRCWIYRFANIIGARRKQGVVYDFVNRLTQNPSSLEVLGDGSQRKPYLHISDCIDGILFGYSHARERINLFNLASEDVTEVRAIVDIVLGEMGLSDARVVYGKGDRGWPGDAPQLRMDMTRMRSLGWRPRLSSDQAVKQAANEHIAELGWKCK
jgi:UDP-glucose 4-epimerase